METAFHIHLPISKKDNKKNNNSKMSPYDMHFIVYCKHYAENNPEYSFKTSISANYQAVHHLKPPWPKWIMNSDILKHALQSSPAHLGWFNMKTYKAPPLNQHTSCQLCWEGLYLEALCFDLTWPFHWSFHLSNSENRHNQNLSKSIRCCNAPKMAWQWAYGQETKTWSNQWV